MRRFIQGCALSLIAVSLVWAQPAQAQAVRSGFNGSTFARNDDSYISVNFGFTINFFGLTRSGGFLNNNGNLTFNSGLRTYTPFPIVTTGLPMLAPFFADVDTRGVGNPTRFGNGTVGGRNAWGATWWDVAHYNRMPPLNRFQMVLIDRGDIGAGDFDFEFNYNQIVWEAGTASGSDPAGLGGTPARVGWSNGSTASFELVGSGVNGAFLDGGPASTALISNSLNSNVNGRYVFRVRNGVVEQVIPEPASLLLLGSGMFGLALVGWKRRRRLQV